MNILFICKANKNRSKTAEHMYSGMTMHAIKSAGLLSEAAPVTDELLAWAHVIFVFEEMHAKFLEGELSDLDLRARVINLDIPDAYLYGASDLVSAIERAMERWWRVLAELQASTSQ